jgi:hypothetical protein
VRKRISEARAIELARAFVAEARGRSRDRALRRDFRRMLSLGIIRRDVFAEVPPRVEYRLTPFGERFVPLLHKIAQLQTELERTATTSRQESPPAHQAMKVIHPMDPTIANQALHFAMEWGEQFMKPTQPRLMALHPALRKKQLDAYDALARYAMTLGHRFVYDKPDCDAAQCAAAVTARFPWVSADNLARLYSQGMYYAHK